MVRSFLIFILTHKLFYSWGAEIKGTVLDAQTSTPLPFVNIYLKNTSIGVVSNEEGIFKLFYEETQTDSIIFSSVGYEKYAIAIKDIAVNKDYVIKLNPAIIHLNGVAILGTSVKELLEQVLNNLEKNYFTVASLQKAHLKQYAKLDEEYIRYIASDIAIYNPSYDKDSKENTLVSIDKNNTKLVQHNSFLKHYRFIALANLFDEISLGTRIKQFYAAIEKFDEAFIEGVTQIEHMPVYKVVLKVKLPNTTDKQTKIIIYVEEKSKAVVSLQYFGDRGIAPDKETFFLHNQDTLLSKIPTYSTGIINYRPFEGKWVLSSCVSTLDMNYKILNAETKDILSSHTQKNYIQLSISETNIKNIQKPKKSNCIDLSKDISSQIKTRHNVKNEDINTLLPTKEERKYLEENQYFNNH